MMTILIIIIYEFIIYILVINEGFNVGCYYHKNEISNYIIQLQNRFHNNIIIIFRSRCCKDDLNLWDIIIK
jgi:hypothetical protein